MKKLKIMASSILVLAPFAANVLADGPNPPPPPPPLHCFGYSSTSASYCANQVCRVSADLAPYQGKNKVATWKCCYKANGTLDSSKDYDCSEVVVSSSSYPYGCCSSVTTNPPACPNLSCPPTHAVP